MSFPDKQHLVATVTHFIATKLPHISLEDQILMLSGAGLNWIGDYITDENISWEKIEIKVDDLYLTGVGGPDWIKIVIGQCERKPDKLRSFMQESPQNMEIFARATFSPHPILVRREDNKLKVLDGMHRVVAAIRDGIDSVTAFVATPTGPAKPHCEPHLIYDMLRAYQRGINTDKEGLITALRWIKNSYTNAETLLKDRFGPQWIGDSDIQEIIQKVLAEQQTNSKEHLL